MIGLFCVDAAGALDAQRVASAVGPDAAVFDGPVVASTKRSWAELDAAVFFLGVGATVGLLQQLSIVDAPAVVCAETGSEFVVSLLGGVSGGGNAITDRVAQALGRQPVFALGRDDVGTAALDVLAERLDARLAGPVEECARALSQGETVRLVNAIGADLSGVCAQLDPFATDAQWTVLVDDRLPDDESDARVVRVVPRTLVVGVGINRGVGKDRIAEAIANVGAMQRWDMRAVKAFATLTEKLQEPGIRAAVEDHAFWCGDADLGVHTFSSAELAAVPVPNPSTAVAMATGTPSVAEAAALLAARQWDANAILAVPKITTPNVTLAVARIRKWV